MKNDTQIQLLSEEQIQDLFTNIRQGAKNHIICDCPLCGKERHFYFNKVSQKWDCKKCGKSGQLKALLSALGKSDLLRVFVDVFKKLNSAIEQEQVALEDQEEGQDAVEVKMPIGFKFVNEHSYLKSRGFELDDYQDYPVGVTAISLKFKEYVIFPVYEEGVKVAFVGRKTWTKQQYKDFESANPNHPPPPRYQNSKSDFQKLLYGIDEIDEHVDTAILVEGLFTKRAVDKRLQIQKEDNFRCLATFGKKISKSQIDKLKSRGIKNIILIFDADAVEEAVKYGQELKREFEVVKIGFVKKGSDLDDCDDETFNDTFANLKSPFEFKINIIQKKKLS